MDPHEGLQFAVKSLGAAGCEEYDAPTKLSAATAHLSPSLISLAVSSHSSLLMPPTFGLSIPRLLFVE